MDARRFERHMRALALARDCVALGARMSTVRAMTGLRPYLIAELFTCPALHVPGRVPISIWNIINRAVLRVVEASEISRAFEELVRLEVSEGEALVTAYRLYATRFRTAGRTEVRKRKMGELAQLDITFDRAYELVRATFGVWNGDRQLQMATCSYCGGRYVACIGVIPDSHKDCPYCRLRLNYKNNNPQIVQRITRMARDVSVAALATCAASTPEDGIAAADADPVPTGPS